MFIQSLCTLGELISTCCFVQDYDKKLTEADAYLQILIEQLKLFDNKLQNCKDDEQRKKIETLKETTNSMVESIKHALC
uniref:Uncharacterized protein n=1 Tax=Marmota marmota marmota TaxID=9994 RepID=A0A8C5YQL3_MARMA